MSIVTTANITKSVYDDIICSAKSMGIPASRLAAMLLARVMAEKIIKPKIFSPVKYQDRDPDRNWEDLKIRFTGEEYEKAVDLRKVLKMSVSFLLALAAKKYLGIILYEYEHGLLVNKTDNNQGYYLFASRFTENDKIFMISWREIPHHPDNPPLNISNHP